MLAKYFIQTVSAFLLVLLATTTALAAEVRYYDFEIIIFQSHDQEAMTSELWTKSHQLDVPEKYVRLGSPYPGPMPSQYSPKHTFRLLPKSSYRLAQEAKLLTANNKNAILLHTSWRQPGMSAKIALPILVQRSYINSTSEPVSEPIPKIDPDMPAVNLPAATAQIEKSRSTLNGFIKIILSRYLHADINLTYTTGLPLENPIASTTVINEGDSETMEHKPAPVIYHLKQTRKMRSKEVHYIDHPVLGVIILATPYLGNTLRAR